MDRRYFIKSSGIALASFGVMTAAPSFLQRALAETGKSGRRKTLIAIFQRGAVITPNEANAMPLDLMKYLLFIKTS